MAQVVSLALAKKQLRVTSSAEDELIELYIDSAGAFIANYLNVASVDEIPGMSTSPTEVPADIQEAALMIITDSFENRGAQIVGQTIMENKAAKNKLYPYRQNIGI